MNKFVTDVAETLEVDTLGLDDDFRATPDWCSLKGFGLLVLLENNWSTPLDVTRFLELKTVRELWREAFRAFAAGVLKVPVATLVAHDRVGSIPEWDSINQLRLVMESEKHFGIAYALEDIPQIKCLDDFLAFAN